MAIYDNSPPQSAPIARPSGANMIRSMWLFKHKFHTDGTLNRYKACLVANGSNLQLGIDCDETFSLIVKPATIRIVLSLVVSRKCPVHQLDVKNAILNGNLSETVYMHQPLGFVDSCEFDMTDLGAPTIIFFGISTTRHSIGLFPSQRKYVIHLLEHAQIANCKPSRTPIDTESKLGPEGVRVQDPTMYHNLAGGLQYLALTRSYLFYAGTLDFGLQLYSSNTTSLVGYTDADWADFPSTRWSTLGYCGFL
uniref:Reverse transcriptase Ty1/copia-type domain-containing protein n=1 Tax=Tanacetum cinerariifolium TaxID=118510 RepID=A0A699GW13_TANCI|nr:hypothetical protein [Tanacetum cinerariifolium]